MFSENLATTEIHDAYGPVPHIAAVGRKPAPRGCGGVRTIDPATGMIEVDMVAGFPVDRHCGPSPELRICEKSRNIPHEYCQPPCSPPIWQVSRKPLWSPRTPGTLPRSRLPPHTGREGSSFRLIIPTKTALDVFWPGGCPTGAPLAYQSGSRFCGCRCGSPASDPVRRQADSGFRFRFFTAPPPFGLQRTPQYGSRCE